MPQIKNNWSIYEIHNDSASPKEVIQSNFSGSETKQNIWEFYSVF